MICKGLNKIDFFFMKHNSNWWNMHIHDEYAMNFYFKVCDTLILHSIHDSKQDTGSYAAPKLFIPRSILVYCDNFRL